MKGKLKFAKFPTGVYYCQITDVKAGVSTKGDDLIMVSYTVVSGERAEQTFKERMTFVSSRFLKAIGEPSEINSEWDTERWRNKFVYVDVKYAPEEAGGWPRYGHYAISPELPIPKEERPVRPVDPEDIPF